MTRIIPISQAQIDALPAQYQTPEVLAFIDALLDNHTVIEQLSGIEFVRATETPAAQPTAPVAAVSEPEAGVGILPKPATLCAPQKDMECYNPFGLDIRALGWNGNDWTFIACDEWAKSLKQDGETISAAPEWSRNGVRYVCAGHREPKSSGPLVENLSGQYQTTMRWYYWPTKEQP